MLQPLIYLWELNSHPENKTGIQHLYYVNLQSQVGDLPKVSEQFYLYYSLTAVIPTKENKIDGMIFVYSNLNYFFSQSQGGGKKSC